VRFVRSVFFLSFLLTLSLSAQEKGEASSPKKNHLSRIYVGPQVAHLELQIRDSNSLAVPGAQQNVKMNGVLGGAVASYEYKQFHALYAAVYADTLTGKITKDGVPSRDINDIEAEVRIGYNYQALQGKKWIVTPYAGFGFNYVSQKQDISPSFKYYSYIVPVGFILEWNPKDWIAIEFQFEWQPEVDSTVRVGSLAGARFVLHKKSSQYFVQMPFLFRFGKCRNWEIGLTPFWKRKKDGQSKTIAAGIPLGLAKQSYTYAGGSLTIGYRF
jgi:hypothetical protein